MYSHYLRLTAEIPFDNLPVLEARDLEPRVMPNALQRALRFLTTPFRALHRALGRKIGRLILPATQTQAIWAARTGEDLQYVPDQDSVKDYTKHRQAFELRVAQRDFPAGLAFREMNVKTADGVLLNTFMLEPESKEAVTSTMIKFVGNSGYYEKPGVLAEAIKEAQEKQCRFVLFNYRGVGQSSQQVAETAQDWVKDALAQLAVQVQHYGMDPRRIFFKAHSLGGGISVTAALSAHQSGYPVKEYSSRSFNLTSQVAAGRDPWQGLKRSVFGRLFGFYDFEIKAGDAYLRLPEEDRDYYCVKLDAEECRENAEAKEALYLGDTTIWDEVSLHERVMKALETQVKVKLEVAHPGWNSTMIQNELTRRLREAGEKHQMSYKVKGRNGHGAPTSELVCHSATSRAQQIVTADDHFNAFYRRCVAKTETQSMKLAELPSPAGGRGLGLG